MTREELYKRIRQLAVEVDSVRPKSCDGDLAEYLAWGETLDRLLDAADAIKPVQVNDKVAA